MPSAEKNKRHGWFMLQNRRSKSSTKLGAIHTRHRQYYLKVRKIQKGAFAPFLYFRPTDLIVSHHQLPVWLTFWR